MKFTTKSIVYFIVIVSCVLYILFFFFFLAVPHGMWDLSSLSRDWTHVPPVEGQGLTQWTARKSQ